MKTFKLTGEQIQFVYNILNNPNICPMKDIASMRKITKFFDGIVDVVDQYDEIRDKYKEEKELKNGNVVALIPASKKADFEEEIKPIEEKLFTIECEREALSYTKALINKVPEIMYKEKGEKTKEGNTGTPTGFGGYETSKLFIKIIDALEDAQSPEKESKKKNNVPK